MKKYIIEAIEEQYGKVPAHIQACASAIRYDLWHGPTFSRIPQGDITKFTIDDYSSEYSLLEEDRKEGDVIEETYIGAVAQALREYIDTLPSTVYVDEYGYVSGHEPEGEYDGDEYIEPVPYRALDRSDIVEIVFGKTIAKEFN
jgi:hypothetical protein